jgi:tRNA-binding EMAP/Myf-like protein
VESNGMLLAAEWDGDVGLLSVDKDAPNGARIG